MPVTDPLDQRVVEMRSKLAEHRDSGDHLKLMPIGSEVPYEGEVASVGSGTVDLRTPLSLDDHDEPVYARVRVAIDRIEAIVVMPDSGDLA